MGKAKKYYWLFAGIFVGLFSVLTAYWNMNILVGSGDLTFSGAAIVIFEYAALVYLLSLIEKSLKTSKRKR